MCAYPVLMTYPVRSTAVLPASACAHYPCAFSTVCALLTCALSTASLPLFPSSDLRPYALSTASLPLFHSSDLRPYALSTASLPLPYDPSPSLNMYAFAARMPSPLPVAQGWDFPLVALSQTRLAWSPDAIVDMLLMPVLKNSWFKNGHVFQRDSLPAYMPANGGLLLAIAAMAGGTSGSPMNYFPPAWNARSEGFLVPFL